MSVSPQIQAEFQRIVTMDLLSSFLDGLDGLAPTLLEVYKGTSRTGKKPALKGILDCLEKDVSGDADDHNLATICLLQMFISHCICCPAEHK